MKAGKPAARRAPELTCCEGDQFGDNGKNAWSKG
jgi:hypothetical protein